MSTADFQALFDQIVAERGGKQALGIIGMSIARALTAALTDPSTPPSTISNLASLLPQLRSAEERAVNLAELTDAELATLEFLGRRAAGLATAKQKPLLPPRYERLSSRQIEALTLVKLVARIAKRGRKPAVTADEEQGIRSGIFATLKGVVDDPAQLYQHHYAPVRVGGAVAAAVAEPSLTTVVSSDNVVALMNKKSMHD
jgi:hypothetical protein